MTFIDSNDDSYVILHFYQIKASTALGLALIALN